VSQGHKVKVKVTRSSAEWTAAGKPRDAKYKVTTGFENRKADV